jgi:hypothetical protein
MHSLSPIPRALATSIIAAVYLAGGYAEADKDLNWWRASGGKRLDASPVRVKAKKSGDSVQALVILMRQD